MSLNHDVKTARTNTNLDVSQRAMGYISIDFTDICHGNYLLVIVNDYSRFPIIDFVSFSPTKA